MSEDLFTFAASRYPAEPGFKRRATSKQAAADIKATAPTLRERCLQIIKESPVPLTADEVAAALGKSVLSVRPRITELSVMNLIDDSGITRPNSSGRQAVAWVAKGENRGGRLDESQETNHCPPC